MNKNFVILAQNSNYDYVKQACVCAMSIHVTNPTSKISIITNDKVPEKYKQFFDEIIKIPWNDSAKDSSWKIENRWKIYHATPYNETIVLDTDMLVLENIDNWLNVLRDKDIFFTNNVYDYRNNLITNDYYRKIFTANMLPNLYTGFHYFKQCDFAKHFYKWIELITNNWELFYTHCTPYKYPSNQSMDVNVSIVTKILDCEETVTTRLKNPSFTHMKSQIQSWNYPKEQWIKKIGVYFTPELNLYIGNHLQKGIFHYTEKEFLTEKIISKYEKVLDV